MKMKANDIIILIWLYHPNCSDSDTIKKNSIPLAMDIRLKYVINT